MIQAFETLGFTLLAGILTDDDCARAAGMVRLANERACGTRCLLSQPWCADLAQRLQANPAIGSLLAPGSVAVQCTYFEKSSERNWLVPFHQDLNIPVAEQVCDPSLRGWSEKEGVLHVRPPLSVLRQLVALRVHLDDCGPDDGPLRVIPGAGLDAVIGESDFAAARGSAPEVVCAARRGDVLALRPLLLHASSKGHGVSRRRVLHFVFGSPLLPFGLRWAFSG